MYGEWEQVKGGEEFDARMPLLLISRYCKDTDGEVKVRKVLNSSRKKMNEKEIVMFMKDMGLVLLWPPIVFSMIWLFSACFPFSLFVLSVFLCALWTEL